MKVTIYYGYNRLGIDEQWFSEIYQPYEATLVCLLGIYRHWHPGAGK
jgi:hypothetical protein